MFIASEARAPRDIEQAVHRVAVVLASVPAAQSKLRASNPFGVWDQAAMTLLMLRTVDRDSYDRFTNGQADACDVGQALRSERLVPLVTARGVSLTDEETPAPRPVESGRRMQGRAADVLPRRITAFCNHPSRNTPKTRMKQNMPQRLRPMQVWKAYNRLQPTDSMSPCCPDIDRSRRDHRDDGLRSRRRYVNLSPCRPKCLPAQTACSLRHRLRLSVMHRVDGSVVPLGAVTYSRSMFDPSRLAPDARVRFPGGEGAVTLVRVRQGPYWEFVFRDPSGGFGEGDAAGG